MSLLEKFIPDSASALCEVELAKITNHHKSGEIYKAEANITFTGEQFYVDVEKDDLYFAIDGMRDEAERIIISRRKKSKNAFRRGAKKIKDLIKGFYK